MTEKLLTVEEMAELSGLSKSYFYCRKNNEKFDLPIIRIGNKLRCKRDDFDSWLESKKVSE